MNPIKINMLGRFDILTENGSALSSLGNSAKSVVILKYLILNGGKPVPKSDLIDKYWAAADKSANPENALKTMISRLRKNLEKCDPALKECIYCKNKSYAWNTSIPCVIDVFQFESLCEELLSCSTYGEDIKKKFFKVLRMYEGDLSCENVDETWVTSLSLHLRHKYVQTMHCFVKHLKQEGDYKTIVSACQAALEIDCHDEELNVEYMNALKENGEINAALKHYGYIADTYKKYWGIQPSETLLDCYHTLQGMAFAAKKDIAAVTKEFKMENGNERKMLLCDISSLDDICLALLCNMQRRWNILVLLLLTVSRSDENTFGPMELDSAMRTLTGILQSSLRRGDAVFRYSASQYLLLLPVVDVGDGDVVAERIQKKFRKKCHKNAAVLSFDFQTIRKSVI